MTCHRSVACSDVLHAFGRSCMFAAQSRSRLGRRFMLEESAHAILRTLRSSLSSDLVARGLLERSQSVEADMRGEHQYHTEWQSKSFASGRAVSTRHTGSASKGGVAALHLTQASHRPPYT